jgi:endonuclease-3
VTQGEIHEAIAILRQVTRAWTSPAVTIVSQREGDPFKVLISCILSLRTKDQTTGPASERLFARAATPDRMADLSLAEIETAIYPVGFYRTKASQIKDICELLLARHGGRVPDSLEELLAFKGVGRKTANLVLALGFAKQAICVDTHVHRICNRWGYVATKTADETEFALRRVLPPSYWIEINDLLVTYGQNLCTPLSPHCSVCPLYHLCERVGVGRHR